MDGSNIIQTKRRYAMLKNGALFIALCIQFFLVFGKSADYELSWKFYLVFIGYIFMIFFYLARGYGKSVYLRYEAGISLIVKNVVINLIMCFFLLTLDEIGDKTRFPLYMFVFTLANLLTIILINSIGNFIMRLVQKGDKKIIYIFGDEQRYKKEKEKHSICLTEVSELDKLEEIIIKYKIIYLVDVPSELRNPLIKICYSKRKTVYFTTKLSDILVKTASISQDGDTPVYYCNQFGIGRLASIIKRTFDIVCSSLALVVLSPVMLVIAILIKCEDGGPVFYSQTRCTMNRREFKIYKFRSMIVASEVKGAQLAVDNDARITRIGKFLRNSKLDELPQLINILKGEMSIVGPRPERPEFIEETIQTVPEFVLRMNVKAGLTGYAQVRAGYSTEFLDKLKWDLMYIENYSFLLDLKIIVLTVVVILNNNFRKGGV